jgi:hypothetical protein
MRPAPADVQVITVIRVEYTVGTGVEDDPFRRLVELHDDYGAFLRVDLSKDEVECGRVASRATTEGRGEMDR